MGKRTARSGMAFEQFLTQKQQPGRRKQWRGVTYGLSLSLHGALLLGMLVRSFWHVDELQPKGITITMMALRLPAPPPAPPERKAPQTRPKVAVAVPHKRDKLVQPAVVREDPPATKPDKDDEPATSDDTGVAGGTEGGVAGGVATMTAAPPPQAPARPVVEAPPIMLAPNIGSGQRLSSLDDPRFRPTLPPSLNRRGIVIWGLFRICVTSAGRVKDVKVLKSADVLVDGSWSEIIHRWEYRPYSIEGHPVAFCHAARIEVRSPL
jgi:protein TonB